jgi:hypothetical protein
MLNEEEVPGEISMWDELRNSHYPAGTPTARVVAALTDLDGRVTELARQLEKMGSRQVFNLRLAALKAAREHMDGLPTEQKNDRGYRDHALRPSERVTQELAVARYLLGHDE